MGCRGFCPSREEEIRLATCVPLFGRLKQAAKKKGDQNRSKHATPAIFPARCTLGFRPKRRELCADGTGACSGLVSSVFAASDINNFGVWRVPAPRWYSKNPVCALDCCAIIGAKTSCCVFSTTKKTEKD